MAEQGWLQISTEGFASFNRERLKQHLVKELAQNAFDAVGEIGGEVSLRYWRDGEEIALECRDTGAGVYDLGAMRVVYLTFKQDSHIRRGRFGRGFKEILSVAESARVTSGDRRIRFYVVAGEKVSELEEAPDAPAGTLVEMRFRWSDEDIAAFDRYFSLFLAPRDVTFRVNGALIPWREPIHRIEAQLATEIYFPETQSWRKPRRKTVIELVRTDGGEAYLYEMGIPVAPAEWSQAFHVNIAQRVPMNPNRDALATGYARRVHAACLPELLPSLDADAATADWVGAAGAACEPEVQRQIVRRAFGENAVRSVPPMGKRDFDDDAERVGAAIVRTGQLSSGFREMAKAHLPSAREVVVETQKKRIEEVVEKSFEAEDAMVRRDERADWIERRGGLEHVNRCLGFAVWFCQQLLDATGPCEAVVSGRLALGAQGSALTLDQAPFLATWSEDNVLSLALEGDCFWERPLGAEALGVLTHEAAHSRNMHHGKSFTAELERFAGVATATMFEKGDEVRQRWPELVEVMERHSELSAVEGIGDVLGTEQNRRACEGFRMPGLRNG